MSIENGDGRTKTWKITISQTNFSHNSLACQINAGSSNGTVVMLTELFFYNNTSMQLYHTLSIFVASVGEDNVIVSILSSVFYYHEEADAFHSDCISGGIGITLDAVFFMNNSNITGNRGIGNPVIEMTCDGLSCLLNF